MDSDNLKIFLRIVEIGSVSGAALQLGRPRTAIRRIIDVLEAELGAPLLHRGPSGVRLTSAGSVLAQRGASVIASTRAMMEEARAASSQATGVLRVIEPIGLPLALHVKIILAAHLALPDQRLEVRHLEDPLDGLGDPFEVMLHEGPAPDRNAWFSRVVLRVPLQAVASRGYIARHGAPTTVADLERHETLGWRRPGHPEDEWPLLAGGVVKLRPWLSSADPHLLATVASHGGGILLAPPMPFFEEDGAPPLQPLLEDQVGGELVFRVTTPFPSQADARTRDTLRLLLAHIEGLFPE